MKLPPIPKEDILAAFKLEGYNPEHWLKAIEKFQTIAQTDPDYAIGILGAMQHLNYSFCAGKVGSHTPENEALAIEIFGHILDSLREVAEHHKEGKI